MTAGPEAAPLPPGAALRTVHIAVPRSARVLSGGVPVHLAASVWYGLHGYGQLAEHLARDLAPLAHRHHLVVPEGLSRFYLRGGDGRVGASWMTREDREAEIADYVRYLDAVHARIDAGSAPVRLLGFSQGVATACRWAVLGEVRPERIVLWGGDLPADLDWGRAADRLRGTPVTLVNGTGDPSVRRETVARAAAELRNRGITADERWFAGGHHLDSATVEALAQD